MITYHHVERTPEEFWRAVVLFGKNVASYKLALARSLLQLGAQSSDLIPIEQLAAVYSDEIVRHLRISPVQIRGRKGKFIPACEQFAQGTVSRQQLLDTTVSEGFDAVFKHFHIVDRTELPLRFFLDERRTTGGIRITDELRRLLDAAVARDLPQETEARWRLVERAWELKMSSSLLMIHTDLEDYGREFLFSEDRSGRRKAVTSCRDAANGYQKGRCFYCFGSISVVPGDANLCEVDHFFPHVLKSRQKRRVLRSSWSEAAATDAFNVDGVWNLVLACSDCNRSKSDRLPDQKYLERLAKRNEYYTHSDNPLRETIMGQVGKTEQLRKQYLRDRWAHAKEMLFGAEWKPVQRAPAQF